MRFVKTPSATKEWDEPSLLSNFRQTGDLEILGRLYGQYMPLVYGLCLKYLKDEHDSKDAVMQIFEQLVKKLRVHEVSNFKSWLYTLARNHCLMALRAAGKHPTSSLEEQAVESGEFLHPVNDDDKEERLVLMENCIGKLPDEQKATIRLFYLDQKCYKEVADLTGYDLNKVKSYIQNGKRNLRICMEKNRGK